MPIGLTDVKLTSATAGRTGRVREARRGYSITTPLRGVPLEAGTTVIVARAVRSSGGPKFIAGVADQTDVFVLVTEDEVTWNDQEAAS